MPDRVIPISELRDSLSLAYHHVKNTDEPIVVQRYTRQEVVLVPLWEWRFLKEIEARIRAGEKPWEEES
ncbi:MAG: type II toxin-antitoxin system Phd/YefM family antitoxin [Pirellulaceae bacterium]